MAEEHKKTIIKLPDETRESEKLTWVNSANTLCNYMRKPEYLQMILKNMALIPRYVEEIIDYLRIPGLSSISFPMTCFCDIPLSKVYSHMQYYGSYGIAFDKNAFVRRNIQPITYANLYSNYFRDFSESFKRAYTSDERIDTEWEFLVDNILSQLLYLKPIQGEMERDGRKEMRLFQDECEWRYIPSIPADMELILPPNKNTEEGRQIYSKALSAQKNSSVWLDFSVDEIVYIIVPDESAAINLIEYIRRKLKKGTSWMDKNRLISKIEIAENFRKNLV